MLVSPNPLLSMGEWRHLATTHENCRILVRSLKLRGKRMVPDNLKM